MRPPRRADYETTKVESRSNLWIQEFAAEISTRASKQLITPLAWRVAAKQWLVKHRLIRIQKAGEVSPNFCQKSDHN